MKEVYCKRLEWDSTFFKKEVGELILTEDYNNNHIAQNFDVIYVNSNVEIDVNLENYKQTLSQIKVMFSKNLKASSTINSNCISSVLNTNFQIEKLKHLAFESGKYSRFLLDSCFDNIKFEQLYEKWIYNSFYENYADDILIYKEKEQVLGFVTYKKEITFARIGLIAVSPNQQGKGIGSKLIKAVEKQLIKDGIFILEIPTQLDNKGACNFYQKLGYSITKKEHIKHFWNNDTIQQTTLNR